MLVTLPTLSQHHVPSNRLDSIGMGGFSHDFGSLKGNASPVMTAFDSFGTIKPSFSIMFSFLLGLILPQFSSRIPNDRKKSLDLVALSSRRTATELLDKAAKEKADSGSGDEVDKSILGALGETSSFLVTTVCSTRFSQIYECELEGSHVGRGSNVASMSLFRTSPRFSTLLNVLLPRW